MFGNAVDVIAEHDIRLRDLRVVYQPIVDIFETKLVGFEALLRWQHPSLGQLRPQRFLERALSSSMLPEITATVFQHAFAQLREWLEYGAPLRLAVNLSIAELEVSGITGLIIDLVNAAGVSTAGVTLEISEEGTVLRSPRALDAVGKLHSRGFRIAIDDFGAGDASLRYLLELPIGEIKLDRSFISGLSHPVYETVIIDVARLAEHLGHSLIVEGVESQEQVRFLLKNRMRFAQGYYISPPLMPSMARAWIAQMQRCPQPQFLRSK